MTAENIIKQAETGDIVAESAMQVIEDRISRGLAMVIGLLDPDIILIGGMLAKSERLFTNIPRKWPAIFAPRSIVIFSFPYVLQIRALIICIFMAPHICAITPNNRPKSMSNLAAAEVWRQPAQHRLQMCHNPPHNKPPRHLGAYGR